jgi:hypothetical protein
LGARDAVVAAVVLTVSVEVPEPFATEFELNAHLGAGVTVGTMPQDRLTAPLKPLSGVMVIVEVADPPAETVAGVSAEDVIAKSGVVDAVTVRLISVLWIRDPEVPVTVTLEVPAGVVARVVIVRVEVTEAVPGVTDGGTKAQIAPAGRPSGHVSATGLLKPFSPLTEIV